MSAKLLVAEDDIFIRSVIAEFLRDVGFDVTEAANADEAMAVFESGVKIDLLFSDVRMPGSMDGSELAERVKDKWPATHVMLTSGYSSGLLEAQRKTHDHILPKPYRPLSVLAAILSVVDP
ncbi:MAG: response regulator receiver protein [Rhodospirillales bacterium]|nr:response regulator receiver protein [Rhodospirillales bacterium]